MGDEIEGPFDYPDATFPKITRRQISELFFLLQSPDPAVSQLADSAIVERWDELVTQRFLGKVRMNARDLPDSRHGQWINGIRFTRPERFRYEDPEGLSEKLKLRYGPRETSFLIRPMLHYLLKGQSIDLHQPEFRDSNVVPFRMPDDWIEKEGREMAWRLFKCMKQIEDDYPDPGA